MNKARVKEIAKARVTVELGTGDLQDMAFTIWSSIRRGDALADLEADYYDCPLCGESMFVSMEYTHKQNCPFEVFDKAIKVFGEACKAALPPLPTPEQLAEILDRRKS